jgi:hypothetical protein
VSSNPEIRGLNLLEVHVGIIAVTLARTFDYGNKIDHFQLQCLWLSGYLRRCFNRSVCVKFWKMKTVTLLKVS